MSACKSRRKAFTLLEMLIVIGIIAILVGLLFPMLDKAKEYARRTRARTEVRQLALAWNSYLTDYREWFPGGSYSATTIPKTTDRLHVRVISGLDTVNNRRGIMFYEFPNNDTNFMDPWRLEYRVYLDPDYNNSVDTGAAPNHGIVPRNVAVWSRARNCDPAKPSDILDDIKSWQ